MQRQLISDQRLWSRVPAAAGAILWPLEVILLGWDSGRWMGAVTVVVVAALTVLVPPRLKVSIYVIDLVERLLRLPLWLGWMLLIWHLGVREPVLPILGQPAAGAVAIAAAAWLLTRILGLACRVLAQRSLARGTASGA
jgi:hypothetical protein